jgi:hypothetical protein
MIDNPPRNVRHAVRTFAQTIISEMSSAYWRDGDPDKFIVEALALLRMLDETAPPMPKGYEVFNPGGPGGKGWATSDESMVLVPRALLDGLLRCRDHLDEQASALDETLSGITHLRELLAGKVKP